MNFTIRLTNLPQVQSALDAMKDRLADLSPAVIRSSILVLTSAQGRIESGGGENPWPPTMQTSPGSPLNRTGTLLRSLTRGTSGNLWQTIPGGLRVGTSLQANGYSIGQMMQYGTGIYGSRGEPITPTHGKFLVFELNGRKIFAKSVKGSPPRPFLYITDADAQRVVGIFQAYIEGTMAT